MNRSALYRPPDDPVYQFARLVFRDGIPVPDAARQLQISATARRVMLHRLRKEAEAIVGRAVSDAMILRMILEPDAAQNDLQKTNVTNVT